MKKKLVMLCLVSSASWASLKQIKIGFIEPLDIANSTSSIRYRDQFDSAIYYAVGQVDAKLTKCGYSLLIDRAYHSAADQLGGVKEALRMRDENTWIIYGPRRSEDLAKVSKALNGEVALVGPMAESEYFAAEQRTNFSMYPSVKQLAKLAIETVSRKKLGQNYGIVADASCPACLDFAHEFESAGRSLGMHKKFEVSVSKQDLRPMDSIQDKVDFIIDPNSSKLAGEIAVRAYSLKLSKIFVGSNGWGDENFGYFSVSPIPAEIRGFAVRSGLSYDLMQRKTGVHSLSFSFDQKIIGPSYSSLGVIFYVKKLSKLLCDHRPSSLIKFKQVVAGLPKEYFKFNIGLRSVEIRNGKLEAGEDFTKVSSK